MTESKKEKITECIKTMCDNKIVDVNYDDINIIFQLTQQNIFTNQVVIHETIEISSKTEDIKFYISGDADEETLAKCALRGYLIQKKDRMKLKTISEYEKRHPFLSLFKKKTSLSSGGK